MNTTTGTGKKTSFLYYSFLLFILTSGISGGYNISVIASSLPQIKHIFIIKDGTLSLLAGLIFAGTALAKLTLSIFNDTIGRRKTILMAIGIFMLGTITIILAKNIDYIIFGRVLQGFGGGLLMFTASLYINEVANDQNRGCMTAFYQLSFTIGLLLANIAGMAVFDINWKLSYVFLLILLIITYILIYFLPCSPR